MCQSQGHNDALPSSDFKLKLDNHVVMYLHSYPWAAPLLVRMIALSVFPTDTTARYDQCGHQISSLVISIQLSSRLSCITFLQTKLKHWSI